ncbi:putative quinol monooxygenase [Sphingomonas corticis]|jgi:quinol monooxygenase YgiN|uniref:Antibiotic biosynthesis monooxygenase n=1 Tax=Sphingomonas corticis TaxID=2722791 RepID=A0ABX1CN35_9SPHN|nr:putative quinol monooxygenase [Sphingomonas corticis]NJR78078.1 antibiotic biosynthesis monooxygenase [Sphingomonas corticis]
MLIVTGSLTARPDNFEAFLASALAHVRRSRAEDGCLHHAVARDCENPYRLVFFETWRDRAALDAHFRVAEAIAFVTDIRRDAAAWAGPTIYEVTA